VFDPSEPFLFGSRNQLTIANDRGCSVTVISVYSKDVHGTNLEFGN
jgi:hypothetical protein